MKEKRFVKHAGMSNNYGVDEMNEIVVQTKDNKQVVYLPEKCIGCGTCTMISERHVSHVECVLRSVQQVPLR
jgi:NAD-dependent dihydropyrimidine dehydrogenase PreA subunit